MTTVEEYADSSTRGPSPDVNVTVPNFVLTESDLMPDPLPGSARATLYVLYIAISVLGLCGNLLTTLVVGVSRQLRTVLNVFLVSLAVSDALIAGVNMPLQLRVYQQRGEWTLGELACKLSTYTQGVVIVVSILTLTSLAVVR